MCEDDGGAGRVCVHYGVPVNKQVFFYSLASYVDGWGEGYCFEVEAAIFRSSVDNPLENRHVVSASPGRLALVENGMHKLVCDIGEQLERCTIDPRIAVLHAQVITRIALEQYAAKYPAFGF